MVIDNKLISQLRDQTGAGIADCKHALEETNGDLSSAIEVLRKKGEIKAAKKSAERNACDGLVEAYIHGAGKVGAMVNVACETDFVAKTDDFKNLVKELAMQVAAMNPLYLSPEEVPENMLNKEKEIYREQLKKEGKLPVPSASGGATGQAEKLIEKIIDGKLAKYYEDICLLNQLYVKDEDKKVADLINEAIAKTGEKIEVREFARFQV